ncbi:MAG: VWA domain-containing protein [Myxococcaceae bacterium]
MKKLFRSLALLSMLSAPAFAADKTPANPDQKLQVKQERPVLDVVFVLDTTSSMGGLIDGAKQKIWSIASRMATGTPTPEVRVGLVAYRDQGDAYVTKVVPLTKDLDSIYSQLMGFRAEGGGDGPEAVQDGLSDAVNKMQWSDSKKVAKMIFLVGDAPAHDQDKAKLFDAAQKAIKAGIVVNTVRCGADDTTKGQFVQVAKLADGHFDSIAESGGVVAMATPYDADLAKLNGELMDTALYAGAAPAQKKAELRRSDAKALEAPAAADRISFMSKSGGGRAASGAEAVGAIDLADEPEKAAKMKKEELPTAMQGMDEGQRVKFAQDQQVKRQGIEKKITELSKKRDDFVAKQAKETKDSFDERVFESVKTEAAPAGVAYH